MQREPTLFDGSDRPIPRARVVTHLPLEPDRSDVDVYRAPELPPVLTEDARLTLDGSMHSVSALVEALGEQLAEAWNWRKEHSELLAQPQKQWPQIDHAAAQDRRQPFTGYAPGSHAYNPGMFGGHPDTVRRLQSAALMDNQRHEWQQFD